MPTLTPILSDADTLRQRVHEKVIGALHSVFPVDLRGRTLELKDVKVHDRLYSPDDQKRALLTGDSLHESIKGTVVLKDDSGNVVDEAKDFTLTHIPYFTERHTFIADGNEYQVANMLRRKPGVYTQRAENGELHTVFNLSKGKNFDLDLNPEKGTLHMVYGTTKVPLYPVLRALGVPHQDIAAHFGAGVTNANKTAHGHQQETAIAKLYAKLIHPSLMNPKAPYATKLDEVRKKLDATAMDPEVTTLTLGAPHSSVTSKALLEAGQKLLHVHEGKAEVDDADSLAFKTFHGVDDFLSERIKLTARAWAPKVRIALTGKTEIRGNLKPAPFSDSVRKFVTTSALTAVPTGINPIELIDHAVKVTALGEGGIPSERAIPYEARMTHPTHYGILDPIRTPECFSSDSEVFTSTGWKKWPDVTVEDYLACSIDGRLEFNSPIRLIAQPYNGPLYGVNTGKLQYLVTPNHRIWCAPVDAVYPLGQSHASSWRFARADEVHGKTRVFDTAHNPYVGEPHEYFELPKVKSLSKAPSPNSGGRLNDNIKNVGPIKMTDWASLVGWYLSEGCVARREKGRLASIKISQSREANSDCCEVIDALLTRLPFSWVYSKTSRAYEIYGKQLATYFEPFGFCQDKYIPEYFFTASIEARENLLEALLLGDGRINSTRATGKTYRQNVFCTTSPRLAADVERLAFSLGKPVRTRKYSDNREERYLDVYEVRLLCDRYRQAIPRKKHYFIEQYNGLVYCATVPGGLMYVRRGDGIGHWSGNSGHAGVDIRATISAHRDEAGNLYTLARDVRTGKVVPFRAGDLSKHVVAFHGQELKGTVDAFVNGRVEKVPAHKVEYQSLHDAYQYSPATSLIPMLRNIQGNRAIMGSKMQTQALPLIEREAPLVQVLAPDGEHSFEHLYGRMIVPRATATGTVTKVEGGFIHIRPETAKHGEEDFDKEAAAAAVVKVPYNKDFPFPSKTYLDHTLTVKTGDKVKEGDALGDSNFTREGVLALGKNLRTAYMPYYGLNSNDAVVISDGCAKKLISEHMYREVFPIGAGVELSKEKHRAYFGPKYTPQQYAHLDADGVVKKGTRVNSKDLLVTGVVKNQLQGTDALLGRISKALSKPYREVSLLWEHSVPGEVVEVVRTGSQVAILVKTKEQMQVGDKLAGRYGNKGVVARIIPDHEMIRDEGGHPIDLIMTSAGVVSRINPAQIHEAILGKVAEKTGKPIVFDNAEHKNVADYVAAQMKEHDVKDKERVYDPVHERWIEGSDGKGVHVGRSYIFKLFKSTDTNFSGHGVGPYDINEQPLKTGGEESAKGIGKMEYDALLAHGARNILREASVIRGTKNDEFWRALQLGLPLPTAKPSFAFTKFTAMLEGAGLKVDKRDSKIRLLPMTDKDILARSTGALQNNKTVVAKNLRPEDGGLFDPRLTGGPQGTLYSHIDLHEPIPHPTFEEPVRRLLGMTQKQFVTAVKERGGAWFRRTLSEIDVPSRISDLRKSLDKLHGAELNNAVKQIKYLTALQSQGLKPHEAYVISKVPVIPPVFRPITPQKNDPSQLMVADANKLYAHLMDTNHALSHTVLQSDEPKHRGMLYNAVGAVFGTHDVENDELKGQAVKGFVSQIAGHGSPKGGFFQRKLMKRTQDISGRGTAVPDGNLGMDEVGMPEQMLWQMFDKPLVARLVRQGYPALDARRLVDSRAPAAKDSLMAHLRECPVLFNRAPTLHRFSVVAAYAKPTTGKTIRVNSFVEKGMNLDYDGDTLQVIAPVTPQGMEDARKMTLSHMLLSDQTKNKLMVFPQHEAVLGVTLASEAKGTGKVHTFDTRDQAMAAYRKGELKLTDQLEIRHEKHAELSPWIGPTLTEDDALLLQGVVQDDE
jgi:DNA-directed RNA polymerase beta subunit